MNRNYLGGRRQGTQLPDGVPLDNTSSSLAGASMSGKGRVVPETATPDFVHRPTTTQTQASKSEMADPAYSRVVVVVEDDEDETSNDEGDRQSEQDEAMFIDHAHPPTQMMLVLLFAIGAVLIAAAVYAVSQNRATTPLCSTQPEWNQYSCRPG